MVWKKAIYKLHQSLLQPSICYDPQRAKTKTGSDCKKAMDKKTELLEKTKHGNSPNYIQEGKQFEVNGFTK
jgi:hypothetical protein